ncbi:MAG: hypothetical protein ACK4RS_01865, partial [Thiothrix sp.]
MTLLPPDNLPQDGATVTPASPPAQPNDAFRAADLMHIVERYMLQEDSSKVYNAFLFAADAHNGQFRADGVTPYITHP